MAAGPPHGKSLVLNTKIQRQIEWLRSNIVKAHEIEWARDPVPPSYTTPPDMQSDIADDNLSSMTARRTTAEILYHETQLRNDMYNRNMEILDRASKMTEEDWNTREMMTSDEDESPPSQMKKVRVIGLKGFPHAR